jgi:acyl-CoA thioester hydrolase
MIQSQPYHTTTYRVRYSDTDKMGVVYHGGYLRLFEIGRTEYLRDKGLPYSELEQRGYMLPVLESHCEYLLPAHYDDLLEIQTVVEPLRGARLNISYEIKRQDATLVRGWTRHTFVRADSFRPIRPPGIFLELLGDRS